MVMPEVVWEMQILLTKCQVQFCLLRKTEEDREVPFLVKQPPAGKVGGEERGEGRKSKGEGELLC